MLLNKQQASSLRDWYTDALQHEVKDDFTRVAVEQAEKDLLNYEIATQKQGLVPYQTNPRIERASFGRVRGIMSGEEIEPDIPEIAQREAATLAYLSMRFQKPPEAVSGALPAFQKAIMDLHPGKDFEAALAEDMDSMDFRLTAIEGAYNHAARHALSGGEELDGYIQYIRPLEREIPEGLAELYMSAFESTREILEENRPAFERLAQSVEVLVQEANLNDTRALFDVVGQLASLPAEDRYLALTYLEANVEAERGPLMNFMNRVNEIARGQARLTPGQIHRNALGIIEDVRAGRPLQESVLLADKQRFDNEFAESAFRVAYTVPGARTPFYRNLSPVEVAKRYEDAKRAGEFAEAMIGIEQYVNEAIGPESFAKNPSFKAAYEQIVYGGARVGADMGMILFSAGFGRSVGGRVDRISGTQGMQNIVGAAYGIQAMIPALQDEHYKMMRAEGLSVEDSYFISASSAPIAASLETMSQLFVLSKLPGISNVAGKMAFMGRRPAVSFAMSTGESVGAEVAAEVASGWTASMMQNFVALIDEDIPTANLSEKLWEQIQQAPDIALNMLPYALIGGGNSAYINRSAQQNLFSNERAMQFFGLNEAAISEVVNAEGLSAKRDAFQKHWDLDRALEMAREAKVRGVSIEDIVSRQAMEAIESASRDEGRVRVLKNEQGEITGYEIDGQDGTAAVRTLPELMELVPEPTQQQIPPVPFVRTAEPDIQTTTEDSPLADPQAQVTMETGETVTISQALDEGGIATLPETNRFRTEFIPLEDLRLSRDVPQFKEDADAQTGVVEPLEGEFRSEMAGPITVWERLDGSLEVISGRHRLDLARRDTQVNDIEGRIFREADGFTQQEALTFDAEQNILDGQGTLRDYAHYFRNTPGLTQETAQARGLLARKKAVDGWSIGRFAEDGLYTSFRNRQIAEAKAAAIARGAPNNAGAQSVAMRSARTQTAESLEYLARRLSQSEGIQDAGVEQLTLLGEDFQALEAEFQRESQAMSRMLEDVNESIRAVKGAARNPARAAELGVDVRDPNALAQRVNELEERRRRLISPDAEMINQIRAEAGLPPVRQEQAQVQEQVAEEVADQTMDMFGEPAAVPPQQLTPKEFTEQLQQRLQSEYPGSIVRISPSRDGTALTLHRVEVPQAQRNQGVGTQIMESLIEAADIRGMQVNLTPDSSFGGSVPRLRRFYKRFGFVENKGRNKDFSTQESMIRPAREATAQPTALDDFVTRQRKRAEDAKKEIGEAWNDLQTLGIVPDQRRATQAELRMIRALANYAVSQAVAAGASVAQAMQNVIREYNLRRTPAVERAIERATRMAEQSLRAIENAQPELRESVLTQELSKITQQTEYTEPTKGVIREQTGQISPEIRMTAREAMRRLYTAQSRAATQAARFTKAELQDIKRQLAEEVVTALPLAERGKFVTAIANVTNQNQLREQIARLEKEVGRLEHRDAKRALKKTIDGLPKRMRPEYEAQVDAIVEAIDTRSMTDKTRHQLESVADFLDRNPENQIPREVLEKLKRLDLKSVDELSAQDLRELNAMLNHYVGLNELKNRLLTDRRKRSRQEVKGKMLTEIEQNRELSDETGILDRVGKMFGKDLSGLERTDRTLVQKYFGEMASRPETMFGEISEQLREMVFDGIEIDGYGREMELRHREQDKLSQRMEEAGKPFGVNATRAQNKEFTRWVNEKVPFQIAGQRINMRRNELVYLYELTQDSNRLQRLLRDGFTIERTGRKAEMYPTVDDLNALPQAIGQAGVALAEGHRETYNGQLRNELNKEWVDVHFFEIAPANDYTPSRTDPTRTAMSLEEMHTERRIMTQEGRGMFKERDANATAPLSIRDSMAVWTEHLDNTAKTVAYMKSGRDARVMLNDQEIKRAIIDRYGEDFWRFTVDKIADQTIGVQGVKTSAFDNMLRNFIQNAGISILSLRMTTPLINPSGVPIAASYMHNPANMGKALSVFGNPAQWRRIAPLMRKWSPYYRERYDNFTQQVTSGIFGERASIYNVKPVAQYGLAGIEATDKVGAYVRWRGAELDIAESRTDLEVGSDAYYREVAREWQKMMFRSENTSHGLGMSGLITAGKRSPWIAPWMIFSSSVSKIYSNARRAVVMAQRGQYKQALMVASSVMASWVVASGMRRLVRNAIRPEDEEEERSFAGDLAREGVGQLPIIGSVLSSALMSIETGRPGFSAGTILDESLTASGRILTNTFNAFESIATDAATREGDPQWQKDALKAIEGVAELTAMATGTPYSALSDWGKLITKVTGEKESGSDFMANLLKERGLDRDPDLTKTRSDQMNRIYRAILEEDPARFQDAVDRLAQGTGERVTRAEIGRSIRGRYNKTWEVRRNIRMSDMTESQRERVQAEMNSYREDLETLNELWKMIPREATIPQ